MGAWYTIGVAAGIGAAAGVLLAAVLARFGVVAAAAAGAVAGAAIGFAVGGWTEIAAGCVGGLLGGGGAAPVVAGALRRGGTRGATAFLVAGVAIVLALLSLIPVVGYLVAVAVPALALRMRRRAPETYAGLRTLARD